MSNLMLVVVAAYNTSAVVENASCLDCDKWKQRIPYGPPALILPTFSPDRNQVEWPAPKSAAEDCFNGQLTIPQHRYSILRCACTNVRDQTARCDRACPEKDGNQSK